MPRRLVSKALSGLAGRHWIVALAAVKCFTTGLLMIGLPVKLDRLGWSDAWLGYLACVNSATYVAACALYSLAVHRVRLRRAMTASCLLGALASLGLSASRPRGLIFVLGPCWALGAAFFWPSLMAWIGESDDEHLAGDMSAFNCSWTLAFTLGSLVGGQVEAARAGWSFYLIVAISLALALLIPFAHIRGRQASTGAGVAASPVELPRRLLAAGWVAAFLVTLCVAVPGAIFIKLNSELGYGPATYGTFWGVRGAVQALVLLSLGVFQGWRYRRWPLVVCLVLSAMGGVLLAAAGTKGVFLVGFMLLGAGMGMGYSMGFYYSVHGRRNRKRNAGLFESVIGAQSIVGGPLGGWLASAYGRRAPYAVLAVALAVAAGAQLALLRGAAERLRRLRASRPDAAGQPPCGK